jgi:uncharacterized protein YchJ
MNMNNEDLCPCKSGMTYGECCAPIIAGEKKAETAEALMRARYSSYVTGEIGFLKDSATKAVQEEFDAEASAAWSRAAQWHGLEIISTSEGGPSDHKGVVEFIPHALAGVFTPLHAAEIIVIGHKAALITGNAGIDRKQFDHISAVGTYLFRNRRGTGLSLTSACHIFHSFSTITNLRADIPMRPFLSVLNVFYLIYKKNTVTYITVFVKI